MDDGQSFHYSDQEDSDHGLVEPRKESFTFTQSKTLKKDKPSDLINQKLNKLMTLKKAENKPVKSKTRLEKRIKTT